MSVPGNGTYNATKFAVRGFTEALRQELEMTGGNVSATCVHPGGIKTNIARASRVSDSVKGLLVSDTQEIGDAFDRVAATSAETAAKVILRAVNRDARRVLVGVDAVVLDKLVRFLPTAYQPLVTHFVRRNAERSA
jgi:short-subunit dehydrogenase